MIEKNIENIKEIDLFLEELRKIRELELLRLRERVAFLEKLVEKREKQVTKFATW